MTFPSRLSERAGLTRSERIQEQVNREISGDLPWQYLALLERELGVRTLAKTEVEEAWLRIQPRSSA